jgi:hypothetical protein
VSGEFGVKGREVELHACVRTRVQVGTSGGHHSETCALDSISILALPRSSSSPRPPLHPTLLLSSKTKLSYKSDLPRFCHNVTEGILRFSPKRILPPLYRPNFLDVSILEREFTSFCLLACLSSFH